MVAQHPDRFLISTCFDNFHWLGPHIDVELVVLESLSSYPYIHIKNIENGLCMWSGDDFKAVWSKTPS